eukprot:scaffold3902_cov430-Prasinococcus_capsulatus_cf.AAC.1
MAPPAGRGRNTTVKAMASPTALRHKTYKGLSFSWPPTSHTVNCTIVVLPAASSLAATRAQACSQVCAQAQRCTSARSLRVTHPSITTRISLLPNILSIIFRNAAPIVAGAPSDHLPKTDRDQGRPPTRHKRSGGFEARCAQAPARRADRLDVLGPRALRSAAQPGHPHTRVLEALVGPFRKRQGVREGEGMRRRASARVEAVQRLDGTRARPPTSGRRLVEPVVEAGPYEELPPPATLCRAARGLVDQL